MSKKCCPDTIEITDRSVLYGHLIIRCPFIYYIRTRLQVNGQSIQFIMYYKFINYNLVKFIQSLFEKKKCTYSVYPHI